MQALEALKRALGGYTEGERRDNEDDTSGNDRIDYPGTAFRVF